jgi:hypothetical protein
LAIIAIFNPNIIDWRNIVSRGSLSVRSDYSSRACFNDARTIYSSIAYGQSGKI